MPLVSELELPSFAYTDPKVRGPRFHTTMRELREQHWLASADLAYFVLDREAVSFFLRSKQTTFPGMKVAEVFGVTEGPLYEEIRHNILHVNGDDHRRLRNLVNPAFTPKAAEKWRPAMRGFLEELWGRLDGARSFDFVEAIAKPYPAMTIATVMGAPLSDAERLYDWSNWIQRQFSADLLELRGEIEQACAEFYDWADALLETRRCDPGDDLISQLIQAHDGEDRLSDTELVNLVLNVLVGGVDTTQTQLSHAIRLFAEHPDQWRLLREDPSLVHAAVEEVVRFEPITPFTARIMLDDVEYRGVTFPKDTILMVSAFDANRDPATYDGPEEFDITADRAGKHPFTFGAGIHYCLGANLAKAEMTEGLTFLAERMPDLALDGEPVFDSINGIYGLLELPVRY
jgi:cytochrome P450